MAPNHVPTEAQWEEDWYAILAVPNDASAKVINKSYRKLALTCHPDKNKDDPVAAVTFERITRTKEFLLDNEIRKEYDEKRKASLARKRLAEERDRGMGERRKRLREELEKKEREHATPSERGGSKSKSAAADLDKLKREGIARREAAQRQAAQRNVNIGDMKADAERAQQASLEMRQVRVKWARRHASHGDDTLASLFTRFGEVQSVSLISGKGNSAIITFSTPTAASAAAAFYENSDVMRATVVGSGKKGGGIAPVPEIQKGASVNQAPDVKDFESVVMMRMRQAAERQRVIRELEEKEREKGSNAHTSSETVNGNHTTNGIHVDITHSEETHNTAEVEGLDLGLDSGDESSTSPSIDMKEGSEKKNTSSVNSTNGEASKPTAFKMFGFSKADTNITSTANNNAVNSSAQSVSKPLGLDEGDVLARMMAMKRKTPAP